MSLCGGDRGANLGDVVGGDNLGDVVGGDSIKSGNARSFSDTPISVRSGGSSKGRLSFARSDMPRRRSPGDLVRTGEITGDVDQRGDELRARRDSCEAAPGKGMGEELVLFLARISYSARNAS